MSQRRHDISGEVKPWSRTTPDTGEKRDGSWQGICSRRKRCCLPL